MSAATWMRRYANPHDEFEGARAVWQVGGLLVVTDRMYMLCADGAGGSDLPVGPKWVGLMLEIAGAARRDDCRATTLGDLWAWLDRFDCVRCPECEGSGGFVSAVPPHADWGACPLCNGDRWVCNPPKPADADTVVFGGGAFDRNRLALWLPAELGEPGQEVVYQTTVRRATVPTLAVFGAGWKLIAAGLGFDTPATRRFPRYRTYTPGAGAWWETRRQAPPAVHPGTDWFMERGFAAHELVEMWGESA